MTKRGRKRSVPLWLRKWEYSLKGVLLTTKSGRFWAFFIPVFLVFGTLLNLLSGGFAAFDLMSNADFGGKLKIIFDATLGLLGINKNFLDWLLIFMVAILQATLIGVIAVIWKYNKERAETLQSSGIAAGLAILGSGCPTCGTALLTPILATVFSSGSYLIAEIASGIVTLLAILVSVFTLRKLGITAYGLITAKNNRKKEENEGK